MGSTASPLPAATVLMTFFSRTRFSISAAILGLSLRNWRALSFALTDALLAITEPGTGLLDHAALGAEVDELAFLGDTFVINDVELTLPERAARPLFFTTFTRVWLPITSSPFLMAPMRRMSRAHRGIGALSALPPVVVSGLPEYHADLHADLV